MRDLDVLSLKGLWKDLRRWAEEAMRVHYLSLPRQFFGVHLK